MTFPDWIARWQWARLGLGTAAVLVVVGLVAVGAWAWYRSQESHAQTALAEATILVQQAEGAQATAEGHTRAIKALETVLADYPRMSAAPQAAYQLGNLKYAAGQYAEARGAYQLALAKGASGTVRPLAAMGIGYTWEAEKNYANAASAYEAVVTSLTSKDFLYEEALVAQARAQELGGKSAAALEVYQRVLREVPDSRRGEEVRSRVASLRSRLPQ
jgi:tetratricopeptide (TPR) repeat protein